MTYPSFQKPIQEISLLPEQEGSTRLMSTPYDHQAPASPIEWVDPHLLFPHPRQETMYGKDDVTELTLAIRTSCWIKPLVVTPQHVILSGHRRRHAALALDWPAVPVERVACC